MTRQAFYFREIFTVYIVGTVCTRQSCLQCTRCQGARGLFFLFSEHLLLPPYAIIPWQFFLGKKNFPPFLAPPLPPLPRLISELVSWQKVLVKVFAIFREYFAFMHSYACFAARAPILHGHPEGSRGVGREREGSRGAGRVGRGAASGF